MSDNDRRAPEWRRLLGAWFTPRLGGTPEAWAAANRIVFARQLDRWNAFLAGVDDTADVPDWWRRDNRRWLTEMCDQVGVAAPLDLDVTVAAVQAYINPRVRAWFDEVPDAIRMLAGRVTLHTASGEHAGMLDGVLRGMGVRELFGTRLYGPDLIGVNKVGVRFYRAVLADSGVDAREALVVDDSPQALDWAGAAGLRTVLMDRAATADGRHPSVQALDQVAGLL